MPGLSPVLEKQPLGATATCARLSKSLASDEDGETECDGAIEVEARAASFPWRYKGPALLCVLGFIAGSNWASSAISPLKSTIRKELGISNAQYGVIASANSLVNTVLPVFSGMAIDYFGPERGSLISSCFILLGAVIAAVGASTSHYATLVAGEVILGLGSTTIETSQSKLYTHWFYGSHLGLVYGLDIAFGRVVNVISKATTVPIMEDTGSWTWSFWVAVIICAATLLLNVAYFLLLRGMPAMYHTPTGRNLARADGSAIKRFSWFSIASVPAAFWIIAMTQLLQSGTVSAYSSLSADVIQQTRGASNLTAGYTSALGQIIPIFLTPVLGGFFDRFGRRMYFVSGTAALYVLVFSLLAFTHVHPLVPVILGSFALAFNALPFIASIPLLVPDQAHIGTAFGIWKAFNNAGSVVMDVSTGAIQDRSHDGPDTYNNVFYFLIAMKCLQVCNGVIYNYVDFKYLGRVLRMTEKQRIALEDVDSPELRKPLKLPQRAATCAGLTLLCTVIITAWVLYLVYSQ